MSEILENKIFLTARNMSRTNSPHRTNNPNDPLKQILSTLQRLETIQVVSLNWKAVKIKD